MDELTTLETIVTTYDQDQVVTLTPRHIAALVELMRATCENMVKAGDSADVWTWGRCYVGDLSDPGSAYTFLFGGDDRPRDGLGPFGVLSSEVEQS